MRAREILFEHNIINLPDLEGWVDRIANKCEFPKGIEWAKSKFRKWLINRDETSVIVASLSDNAPEWMRQRSAEGIPLHRFRENSEMTVKLEHVIDWLNSMHVYATQTPEGPRNDLMAREAQMVLSKLQKFSVEQAIDATDKWFARLSRSVDTGEHATNGTLLVMETPVGNWYELVNQDATRYEGKMMNHCVGGGSYTVGERGRYRIFSLRNRSNEPHVTVSILRYDNSLNQIKGKQNQPPVAKYQRAVIDLLNKIGISATGNNGDLQRCGIYYQNRKFGGIEDVSKKEAEIDSVSVYSMSGSYHNDDITDYYFWRSHVYGKLTVEKNQLSKVEFFDDKPAVRSAVWKIMAEFLNLLEPFATPANIISLPSNWSLPYRDEFYANTREQLSDEVGVLSDGSKVLQYRSYKENDVDFYDKDGNHTLTLTQHPIKLGYGANAYETYEIRAKKVKDAEVPPPESIIEVIRASGIKGGPTRSLRELGVWATPPETDLLHSKRYSEDSQTAVEMVPFNPTDWDMVKITDDLYGAYGRVSRVDSYANYLYSNKGKRLGQIQLKDSSHTSRGLVRDAEASLVDVIEKKLKSHPVELAAWFNQIGFEMPTRQYQREQLKPYGVARKQGLWVAVSSGKTAYEEDGFTIQTLNKSVIVLYQGKEVIKAQKGRDRLDSVGFNFVEGASFIECQKGLLVLDSFLAKEDWEVRPDSKLLAKVSLTRNGDARRQGLVPAIEIQPNREVSRDDDGSIWTEYAMHPRDLWAHDQNSSVSYSAARGKYRLTDSSGMVKARVFTDPKTKAILFLAPVLDGKLRAGNTDNVVGLIPALTKLIEAEGLRVDRTYFGKKLGLTLRNGQVRPLADDHRLQEYLAGEINYEDGKRWKVTSNDKNHNWELELDVEALNSSGEKYITKRTIMKIKVSTNGLERVDMNTDETRRKPKEYMGYVMDLLNLATGDDELESSSR